VGQRQGGADDVGHIRRSDPQLLDGLVELHAQPLGLFAQVELGAGEPDGRGSVDPGDVEPGAASEHAPFDLGRQHGVDLAEVLADGRHLGGDPGQKLQVPLVAAGRGVLPAGADEVLDLDGLGLAVPVQPADPLLQPVGVERDVVVDDPVAVQLQVDALAGAVVPEQDPDQVTVRRGLERVLDALPERIVHPAVQQAQAVPAQALGVEPGLERLLGVPVLGEDDDALVVPRRVGPAGLLQPGDQPFGLGVGPVGVGAGPLPQLGEDREFLGRGLLLQPGSLSEQVLLGLFPVLIGPVLVGPKPGLDQPRRQLIRLVVPLGRGGPTGERVFVHREGDGERRDGGEQPLLEQQRDHVGRLVRGGAADPVVGAGRRCRWPAAGGPPARRRGSRPPAPRAGGRRSGGCRPG
jgi:hypothetical protein